MGDDAESIDKRPKGKSPVTGAASAGGGGTLLEGDGAESIDRRPSGNSPLTGAASATTDERGEGAT